MRKSTRIRDTAKNEPYCHSTRMRDTRVSSIVTQYIYENLYKHIYEQPVIVDNRLAQLSGIDISLNVREATSSLR